jgi:hypothetical protein
VNESEIVDRLARIDVKLDQLLARDDDHETRIRTLEQRSDSHRAVEDLKAEMEKLQTRVAGLERFRWLITGAAAGAGGIVGSLLGPLLGG